MTILGAVTNVANEAGYAVDTSVIGSTDVTTKQLLAIANRVIKEMADAYPWPQLFKQGTVTLATSTASYALPGDFSFYHYDSFWNQDEAWRVLGPLNPQEKSEIEGYGLSSTIYNHFQLRGVTDNYFTVVPTPTASENGQDIIFEYAAARPVRPQTWVTGTSFSAGSYCFYNGNYYSTTAGGTAGATAPTHTSSSASDGTVTWDYYDGTYEEFLADTDVPVLSQRILEQGMLERFAEIHGITVQPRFEMQLRQELTKQDRGQIGYVGGVSKSSLWAENGTVFFGRPK